MKTRYDKLVRDQIPAILAARGVVHEVRAADESELSDLLRAKLREELAEYLEATDDDARLDELADMLEAMHELAWLHGGDPYRLENIRARKTAERGGFESHIVLVSTGSDE